MTVRVREVTSESRDEFRSRIAALEEGVTYPLGDDRFALDHGDDYFAFFDRLGDVSYFVALDDDAVVAVAAGVMRWVPPKLDAPPQPVWYGCDLKVAPSHRGRRLPFRILLHALPRTYPKCPRGYGITMLPGGQATNRVTRLARRVNLLSTSVATFLEVFSLAAGVMAAHHDLLQRHRGPVSYLSLAGKKDLILESTSSPFRLLHAQFGPMAAPGQPEPLPGHTHMFCVPVADPLARELRQSGVVPTARAVVLQHRMRGWDWSWILTSDI